MVSQVSWHGNLTQLQKNPSTCRHVKTLSAFIPLPLPYSLIKAQVPLGQFHIDGIPWNV